MKLVFSWNGLEIVVASTANNQNPSFQVNDTELYVPVVTIKHKVISKQLESSFKRTINWNKYLPKTTNQAWNRYLDYLIGPSFQGINRHFVFSFKDYWWWSRKSQAILSPNCWNKRL